MSYLDLEHFDLSDLPTAENDEYEFKSSMTSESDLKKKLQCAASAFANSGGGYFIAGVANGGDADGGVAEKIGKQNLRDWADNVIRGVEPSPLYEIKLIDDAKWRGVISQNRRVLVVAVEESQLAPHMAPDYRYYIRAGAHTIAARQFIVDAIWAKRHFAKPRLSHVFRTKPDYRGAIQLGVVALTTAPAVAVEVSLLPLGELLRGSEQRFPLQVPMIDRENPFFFDVTTWYQAEERFGRDVRLTVNYKDLAGNAYTDEAAIQIGRSIGPLVIGTEAEDRIAKAVETIAKRLDKVIG